MKSRMLSLCFVLTGWVPFGSARAQLVEEFKPPKANCCLQFSAQALADQLQDWNQIGRFYNDNLRLRAQSESRRVVFIGDAITSEFNLSTFFPNKPYVNRGIPGQTTPQMLVRFFPDVINLKPAAVVIAGGINDISRNTGPQTLEMIGDNVRAMCELAQKHNIKVVLALLLPVSDYTKHQQTGTHPLSDIVKLNDWLRKYASEIHAEVADYYSVVVDSKGMLKEGFSEDGAHANAHSYALMAPVAETAIGRALK